MIDYKYGCVECGYKGNETDCKESHRDGCPQCHKLSLLPKEEYERMLLNDIINQQSNEIVEIKEKEKILDNGLI